MGKSYAAGTLESLMRPARGRRVLLDRDAAEYFQVRLSTLSATVERRRDRFPGDFLLAFRGCEAAGIERRYGVSRPRKFVRAFTEVGIEALAGSLKSERAIAHSLETIRRFFADRERLRSRGGKS
ncbi:MAG: ORF6N domain-containing protein [Elusimicrobia bacterium]|nr:ORF6N domain-containing protein [Elusimicrobiota bacterium]